MSKENEDNLNVLSFLFSYIYIYMCCVCVCVCISMCERICGCYTLLFLQRNVRSSSSSTSHDAGTSFPDSLSLHPSLSTIALITFSKVQTCVRTELDVNTFSQVDNIEVHRRTSLMYSSLFLHLCPACLFRLTF